MPIQMTRQEYEERFKKAPEPQPEIMEAAKKDGIFSSPLRDLPGDFAEFGGKVESKIRDRFSQFKQSEANRQADGKVTPLENYGRVLSAGAGIVGAGLDTAAEGIGFAAKSVLTQGQEDFFSKIISKGSESLGEGLAKGVENTPALAAAADEAKYIVSQYNEFAANNPQLATAIKDQGTILQGIVEVGLTKGALSGSKQALKLADEAITTTGTKVDDIVAARRLAQVGQQEGRATEAAQRILQDKSKVGPRERNLDSALNAFQTKIETPEGKVLEFNPRGINDYETLNARQGDLLSEITKEQERYLGSFDTKFTTNQLGRFEKAGNQTVVTTPVSDALDQIINFYQKTGQGAKKAEYESLKSKMDGEGLTVLELNRIARTHGRDLNAFNVNGELASGLNRQNAENTRKGVKEVLRERLPDTYSKELDAASSDLLSTLNLTRQMEKRVNDIKQKLEKPSLYKQFQRVLFETVDIASLRSISGVSRIIGERAGNFPTRNAVQLEQELQKNLREIERLADIKDRAQLREEVQNYISNVQPGLSTQNISGKADRIIKFKNKDGKALEFSFPADEAREYAAYLESQGIKYEMTTK